MVACGPFTVSNELSYDALKDLMAVVNRDSPHALILSGPFISQNHEDITAGDLRYRDAATGELKFMDYDELLEHIVNYIYTNRADKSMDVILVPSTSEITHTYPMPQPPMEQQFFKQTAWNKTLDKLHLASNPSVFMLNDISVGFVNTDIIRDLCTRLCIKNPAQEPQMMDQNQSIIPKQKPKIDLALQAILEQKSFYPLYPGNQFQPIEWEQFAGLMFDHPPDILITPSELITFAKVSILLISLND